MGGGGPFRLGRDRQLADEGPGTSSSEDVSLSSVDSYKRDGRLDLPLILNVSFGGDPVCVVSGTALTSALTSVVAGIGNGTSDALSTLGASGLGPDCEVLNRILI